MPALYGSCTLAAARAWLGYVPSELQQECVALFQELSQGIAFLAWYMGTAVDASCPAC